MLVRLCVHTMCYIGCVHRRTGTDGQSQIFGDVCLASQMFGDVCLVSQMFGDVCLTSQLLTDDLMSESLMSVMTESLMN